MKAAIILLLLASVTSSAMAGVIATTFGPTDSFASNTAAIIGSEQLVIQGAPITIPNDSHYRLDYVDIPVSVDAVDGVGSFTLDVMDDNAGVPGMIIESFLFPEITAQINVGGAEIVRGTSVGNITLLRGETYWLVGSVATDPNSDTAFMGWHLNDQGIITPRALRNDNEPWQILSNEPDPDDNDPIMAYRVAATPIPEPSSFAMVVIMLGTCVLTRRLHAPCLNIP